MFNLKFLATATIILGGTLTQQAAIAYPKASQEIEINYLKTSMQNLYGNISQESTNLLVQMYKRNDPSTEMMLSGGYQVCDGIKMANAQGLDTKTLIKREIDNISRVTNNLLAEQNLSFSQDQIATSIRTAKNYLCPELR